MLPAASRSKHIRGATLLPRLSFRPSKIKNVRAQIPPSIDDAPLIATLIPCDYEAARRGAALHDADVALTWGVDTSTVDYRNGTGPRAYAPTIV